MRSGESELVLVRADGGCRVEKSMSRVVQVDAETLELIPEEDDTLWNIDGCRLVAILRSRMGVVAGDSLLHPFWHLATG